MWLLREFFRAFRGLIPENFEAYAVDGNRSNLSPSNLDVRPKAGIRSKFRLNLMPKSGWPPAA